MSEEEINFESLNLPINKNIFSLPIKKQREVFHYLRNLDDINKQAYNIAFNHLGTSFNVCRSNGFIEWKKSKLQN